MRTEYLILALALSFSVAGCGTSQTGSAGRRIAGEDELDTEKRFELNRIRSNHLEWAQSMCITGKNYDSNYKIMQMGVAFSKAANVRPAISNGLIDNHEIVYLGVENGECVVRARMHLKNPTGRLCDGSEASWYSVNYSSCPLSFEWRAPKEACKGAQIFFRKGRIAQKRGDDIVELPGVDYGFMLNRNFSCSNYGPKIVDVPGWL